jgi:hypothetical protein
VREVEEVMKHQTNQETAGKSTRAAILCAVAAIALGAPGLVKSQGNAVPVEFHTVITGTHIVPDGSPLPGLHAEAKVKGENLDIYIAPLYFVKRYDVRVNKGEDAEIVGMQAGDVVLARNITTGVVSPKDGKWRPTMTIYMRNDAGPLW